MSNLINETENKRLDDITAYTSTVLSQLSGDKLEAALMGHAKRRGRSDSAFRAAALECTHPDDLLETLITRGYTLASVGIESINLI